MDGNNMNNYNENTNMQDAYNYGGNYEYASYEDDVQPSAGSGLAITSMCLGIASLVIIMLLACCIGLASTFIAMPFAIAGLICGIIGLKKGQSKGMCVAGIVCSGIALALVVVEDRSRRW